METSQEIYRWIVCGVITLESVISWKFRHDTGNIQDEPTPFYISIPWVVTVAIFIGYYLYLRFHPQKITKYGDSAWEIEQRKKKAALEKGEDSKKTEKKEEVKQKKEEQTQKAENKKNKEEQVAEVKNRKEQNNKKVVEPSSPDVTEQRKNWNKKKTGEKVEAPKQSQPTRVETVPEESEWRVVGTTNPGKKSHKKKKD